MSPSLAEGTLQVWLRPWSEDMVPDDPAGLRLIPSPQEDFPVWCLKERWPWKAGPREETLLALKMERGSRAGVPSRGTAWGGWHSLQQGTQPCGCPDCSSLELGQTPDLLDHKPGNLLFWAIEFRIICYGDSKKLVHCYHQPTLLKGPKLYFKMILSSHLFSNC